MIDLRNTEGVFFVGIGGIGMSALALYFRKGGYSVAGYDRTSSAIADSLEAQGCSIIYNDDPQLLPALFREEGSREKVLVVYTPAIPSENLVLSHFRAKGYRLFKRAEILGEISEHTDTLAVAGTHGKTTVSTMTAHLLTQSETGCSAFLGGISKNYDSNLLTGESRYTVMEADEFDRSFHRLSPFIAAVTSLDADHLDIYGDHATMVEAYNQFIARIRKGGSLIVNSKVRDLVRVPEGVSCLTYGLGEECDYRAFGIERVKDYYNFSVRLPGSVIADLRFAFPGIINIENFTAAIAIASLCGVREQEIRKGVLLFRGVRRRFDIRIDSQGITYVDDYAHHPEEIRAFVSCVREYFGSRKITGIFQPHLFSRTLDHAQGFAEILDELDEVILLPIYPAREKPIPGVSSELILDRMRNPNKRLLEKRDIPSRLDIMKLDVLLTIGAGDIDSLAGPIEKTIRDQRL